MDWVDGEGSVSATFEAVDQRKVDMLEALRASRARDGGAAQRTRAYAIGCMATPVILAGACLTSVHDRPTMKAAGFAMMIMSVLVLGALQRGANATSRAPKLDVQSHFTVRVARDALAVSADGAVIAEIPLSDVADVVGGSHLEVVRQNGTRLRLPLVVPRSSENDDMATEIIARVREMRAAAGGYRG